LGLGVDPVLSDIVARLLEKEPDRRYQSAEGLARDLALLAERPGCGFELGAWDFPPRLSAPSRLIGRDDEIATLKQAFEDALLSDTSRCVLVAGGPGVGKSSLINELRPAVAVRGGWFVTGKCDQFRPDAEVGAVLQAMRGIGRLLLAEPDAELAATRTLLLKGLGSNTGLVTAALPEFAVLLGSDGGALPGDPGDPGEARIRLRQAMIDLLRVVVSPERPLIMVLDDLQWADPVTLGLMDAVLTADGVRGLLVVGGFRSQEVDAVHPLSAMLARWHRLGLIPSTLSLENLPPAELSALLAEMLRLSAVGAAELADAVRGWTAGNPYDTVELINALRRDEALALSEHGWSWDAASIRRHVGQGDVLGLLSDRIACLPPPSRELLRIMACLGGEVRLDVLAAAVDQPVAAMREGLAAPLEDGLLILDQDGSRRGDHRLDSVRFRHDRVHQAAYAGLDPAERSALHLALGRRLARSSSTRIEAAEQYLGTDERPSDAQELRHVAQLYRAAATNAQRTSSYAIVERYLSAAMTIWDALGTAADDPSLVDLEVERHAALHSLGRLDEADAVYASIERRGPEPVVLAAAACAQLSSLSQRNRQTEALALGLALLTRLGVTAPYQDFGDHVEARTEELVDWASRLDLAGDLSRPEIDDARVLATERLFSRLLPTAFFVGEPSIVAWIVLESQRMWSRYGPAGGLAANLSCVGLWLFACWATTGSATPWGATFWRSARHAATNPRPRSCVIGTPCT
ncbi:MAG TPA: AAA family ATPase, partial [Kineosporiaceae bacterium]|nr:AAA family ATPase [Kineosporiaceae bacterium]